MKKLVQYIHEEDAYFFVREAQLDEDKRVAAIEEIVTHRAAECE